MPVLKIKKDGIWEELGGSSSADGGNADTLDGKHASDFASATDVSDLQTKVGDINVSDQIANAISTVIPTVTTEDNGKFLRVVNGNWVAATISSAEEAGF